jgi:5-(aminomethyl)-3-furanmethanol phosphate kinase
VIVVKIGGSLFDHPRFGPGLRAYLESLAPAEVLLVPGGGDMVEAVRNLDRIHGLGEEASHWLAIQAMTVNASVLERIIDLPTINSNVRIPDCLSFVRDDEDQPGTLPHSWQVTSDSIAARLAVVVGADQLILLKSVDIAEETSWTEAAERGWVDSYFPNVISGAAFSIESLNFRDYLESLLP